jgi:preprotein translocase subunit SecE
MAGKKSKRSARGGKTAAKKKNAKAAAPKQAKQLATKKGKKAAAAREASGNGTGALWERSVQFLREVKTELKKVTWPSRRQTMSSTGVVLVLVLIVSLFLGFVDFLLARLVNTIIG